MQPNAPLKTIKQPNTRLLTALLGLIFLIIGQYQIAQPNTTAASPTKIGVWLIEEIHLAIPSIDNVVRGLPVLLAGAVLLFISLRGFRLLPDEAPFRRDIAIFLRVLKPLWPWLAGAVGVFALLLWQISYLEYSVIMLIEWLLAPILALTAIVLWDLQREINLSPGLGRKDILWMLGLFTISIVIGVYRLQGMPDMLIGDEGSFWTTARGIAEGDYVPSIFANGVYTFPILSSIGQAAVVKVFGLNLWGWRFSSVLAGALTIFPLYLLANEAFNRKVAIASGFALAFSPYFLAFARLGYNNIQALFITTLALYWIYTGLQRSSFFYVFLAGCAAGLGFYTYFSARMALVIVLLFIGLMWLIRKIKFSHAILSMVIFLFGATLFLLPHLIYGNLYDASGMSYKVLESMFFNTYNGEQFYSREQLAAIAPLFNIGDVEFFYNPKIYLVLILRGFIRTFITFQKSGIIAEHFIAFPLAGTIGVIFYLLGFGSMFKRIKEPRNLLLIVWFVVILFGLSALNTVPPRQTHIVNIIPLLALLIGLGINILVNSISALIKLGERAKIIILGILTSIVIVGGTYDYFVLMPKEYFPQPDQVISWAGFSATDETLVYVYKDNVESPLILAYSTQEFRTDIQFEPITFDQFQANPQAYNDGNKYIVFYMPTLAEEIEPILAQTWGTAYINRDFFNPDNVEVLSAGMNTPFVFERDRSFGAIFKESYLRLSLLLFLAGCLIVLGMVAFIPAKWLEKIPLPAQAVIKWFNTPHRPIAEEISPEEIADEVKIEFVENKTIQIEPPEWAQEVTSSQEIEPAKRIKFNGKVARNDAGRDLYLRVHIPAIKIKTGWQIFIPDLQIPAHILLIASIAFAILAQVLIFNKSFLIGAILYGICAALLVTWVRLHPKWVGALTNHVKIQPKLEIAIAIALLLVVIFTRFYDIGYRVYGIEADESKWTVQAWYSAILQVDKGEFAGMHYQYLPVTFWVRSFFLRVFGLDFISARIESATHSVIAVIFLYLLVKRLISNPPIALLAASLYAFSYVELNTSHQALHNTTIEPWMMAGLYFIILAIQSKKVWAFQVAGIILALGMLTYETIFPTVLVALVSAISVAVWQVIKRQASLRFWLPRVVLFVWPIVISYFMFIRGYLNQEQYHFGWMTENTTSSSIIINAITYILQNIGLLLKAVFSEVVLDDSLLRWHGSYINQLLLPFAVVGLVYNLINLRRRPYLLFIPLWYLLNVIAAPISVGAVWPRILYSSLGPLMVWGAVGLWVCFAILRSLVDSQKLRLSSLLFGILLLTIFASDYYIFTNKINDPIDRVQRRELADITAESAARTDMVLVPYLPTYNDPAEVETHVLIFAVASQHNGSQDAESYFEQVPFNELLVTLWESRDLENVEIIYDKSQDPAESERASTLAVVLQCYPDTKLETEGEFFAVYRLDSATLSNPLCYQAPMPTVVSPIEGATIPSGTPVTLEWASGVESTGYSVTLQQRIPNIYWIEAEDVFANNGWYVNSTFVLDFTGSGFLEDNWEAEETLHYLYVEQAGEYRIWVRSYKRRVNDQINYLGINGENFQFAGNNNPLDQWVWESIGTMNLSVGSTPISLSRVYAQDEQYSVFIDAILITPSLDTTPENNQVWQTVYSEKEPSDPASRVVLGETLEAGDYRWSVRVFDGTKLVDSLGNYGILMPSATFTILP